MSEHLISFEHAEKDFLSCAAYLAENIKSSDGRAEAMKAIVPQYLAKGNVDLAAALSDTIEDPFTRDKLLILVAAKCTEQDDDDYAMQLVEAIEDYGLQSQARERMALEKIAKKDFDGAFEMADSLEHPDDILGNIAVAQASDGKKNEAMETLARIEFPTPTVWALEAMALAELKAQNENEGLNLLDQAITEAFEIGHDEEKIRVLCDLGNCYVDAKQNSKAIQTFEKARGFAEKVESIRRDYLLASAALGFMHAGSIDLADRTLDLVADKTQLAGALAGFAREFWQKDEKDDAIESLEEAYAILKSQREIETRDSRARFALFTSIAAQFAGFGKGERAIEITEGIADEREKTNALSQIVQILTLQKDDRLARQALAAIPEDADRVFALIGASHIKAQAGEKENSIEILIEAAELAETVPQVSSRAAAYIEIAQRLNENGESAKALEVARRGLQAITEIKDESSQAVALTNLARLYEQVNFDLSDAERNVMQAMLQKSAR